MGITKGKHNELSGELTLEGFRVMKNKSKFYEKYVGCPILATKVIGAHGEVIDISDDPYYQQIQKQALIDNVSIRNIFPKSRYTMDLRMDRLNINFKQINENMYEITKVSFG